MAVGLGIGYWVLGIRYWVLDIGYWVLGIRYWVLGIGQCEHGYAEEACAFLMELMYAFNFFGRI